MEKYSKEQLKTLSKDELIDLVVKVQNDNILMAERIAVLNEHRFGRSSEKLEYIENQLVFNEVEDIATQEEEPVADEKPEKVSKKTKGKRELDLSKLDHVVVNHELTEEQLTEKFAQVKFSFTFGFL